jgi:hypothetical protein
MIDYEDLERFVTMESQNLKLAGRQWFTPVILATQEAKIRRIAVQSQPWANSL